MVQRSLSGSNLAREHISSRGAGIYILNQKFPRQHIVQSVDYRSSSGGLLQHQHNELVVREIQEAFKSIVWFTYRRNFNQALASSTLKGDAGWGCMLRTGQMMLFQALKRHRIGN